VFCCVDICSGDAKAKTVDTSVQFEEVAPSCNSMYDTVIVFFSTTHSDKTKQMRGEKDNFFYKCL
jgi:hypothetical protein